MIARWMESAAVPMLLLVLHVMPAGSTSTAPVPSPPERASRIPRPPSPAAPPDPRMALWVESVAHADTAVVMRLEIRPRSGSATRVAPGNRDTRVVSSGTVGRSWIARFAKLLRVQSSFDPNGVCVPAADSSAGDDSLVVGIRFGSREQAPSAVALFREHCVELQKGAAAVGRVELEPASRNLVALAREALPGDEVVRRLSESYPLAHPAADSLAKDQTQPRIVVVPPTPEEVPKLGDYVYVEELPEAIVKVPPQYPEEARKAGVDGTVLVQALVGKDGRVSDVRVQKSIPALDAAAVACVYQWRFKPALAKGDPVAVWVAIPIRFALH